MLSSLLLNKSSQVDQELDALFRHSTKSPVKRKREAQQELDNLKRTKKEVQDDDASEADPKAEDEDDSEADPLTLIHESLVDKSKNRPSKQKFVPSDETPIQKDQRTIFVGNLPLQVAQKRPLQKQLQRHILSFIPSATIESTRFRSVPFNTPTSNLSPTPPTPTHKNPSQRTHDRSRASSWKSQDSVDPNHPPSDTKQFLNPSQKKKIAFINHEFHSTADTVHAYIVFAYPMPQDSRPKNLPPLDPVMDPFLAAKEAVKNVDGTLFMERIIRVDSVGAKPRIGDETVGEEGDITSFGDADPKCTLFVGNLEFTSEEGDLRAFFETLVKTERGNPPTDTESAEKKPHTWVKRVRIIKDKETQLGKGFAYIQFIDRECVDTLLTFTPDQLKFAKRKLRINRCKTIQGSKQLSSAIKSKLSQQPPTPSPSSSKNPQSQSTKHTSQSKKPSRTISTEPIEIPKGDPTLGTKLAHLSKSQRKQAKASDADRVARRLAKKKARMAMSVSVGDEQKKNHRRERDRVRKVTAMTGGGGKRKQDLVGKKKGRVRSEKSLEKRNMKK